MTRSIVLLRWSEVIVGWSALRENVLLYLAETAYFGLISLACRITPLTPSMLEVVTALAAEEEHSTATSQGTAEIQRTADFQGTAEPHDAASIPKSPNDYTPTDASETSGGDEGLLDVYALNREVRRLKKQTLSQAKLIRKLKAKLKKLSKFVQPVVKHHALWVENQNLKKQKRRRKKHKKKVSSVKLETEEVNIKEKEASNVRSGDTEELDLETTQSTARQGTITPRTLNFEDEAGPIQTQPQQPTQGTDPKDKGKGILVEEPKKKKLTLQQIRALETTNDEEVARKIQAEWDAEEEIK
ncbi:hypothetical protein Tco_1249264 [Tanacetum coccineum]